MASGPVTLSSLGPLGEELGSGGQGTVYALPQSGSPALVYKAYSPEALSSLQESVLTDMVALPGKLSTSDRRDLMAAAAWPRAAVTDGGRIRGFTMTLVPKRFHTTLQLPSGRQKRLGQIQLLLNPPDYLNRVDLTVNDRRRLELLADIARALRLFHRIGLTVGDLSPNNLLFSFAGTTRCHFIDCDAMRLHGRTVLPQVETTDWEAPHGGELATKESDTYKFALLAVRLFAGDQSTTSPDALRRAGDGLHVLAVRALTEPAADRPSLSTWENQLRRQAKEAAAAPQPITVTIPPTVTPTRTTTRIPVPPVGIPSPGIGVTTAAARSGSLSRAGHLLATVRRRSVVRMAVLALLVGYGWTHTTQIESWWDQAAGTVAEAISSAAQEQADEVAAVLAASAPVRTKVKGAVGDLKSCKRLKKAVSDLGAASAARQKSLTTANALTVSDLDDGTALKAHLVAAFKHSKAADDAYKEWGVKLTKQGCRKSVRNGSARAKGDKESAQATKAKQEFVKVWDQVGPAYGHPAVEYQDI